MPRRKPAPAPKRKAARKSAPTKAKPKSAPTKGQRDLARFTEATNAAAQAALDDGAQALVIDVLGHARAVIAGPDLVALATRPDSGPDERITPSNS